MSRLESVFYKKARGRINATVDILPETLVFGNGESSKEVPVKALLSDASGSVVASVTAHWSVRRSSSNTSKALKGS